MAEFVYNNARNTSTNYIFFVFNYGYYLCISYVEDIDLRLKFKAEDEFLVKL